jgi:hypothetical protein
MLLERSFGGLNFRLGLGERGFDFAARQLHLAFDLHAGPLQLSFDFPAGLLEFAALVLPCSAEVPPEVFKWIAYHDSPRTTVIVV